ncbi:MULTISPECIES: hypothetical protein [Achromobacter]|uniref:hypothetical protein n=1 Tax=Achromobacter TaxID=222 RepID=UPI001403DC59|nr:MULTISPECIES: hypothetical protein [Achromobacter]MBC9904958.1 hypothetical protein [Achromobacter xylosoxidans]MBD0867490.1 hypothetical protein [Achromobacter xylosoxidans]MDH1303089.1 hypothetical protein [Achromobacter sp. GD03932]QNP88502.1 hypothetical protein IAG39_13750 [Achromobacter xylosoxidans]
MHALITDERVFRLRLASQASEVKWISLEIRGETSESDTIFRFGIGRLLHVNGI